MLFSIMVLGVFALQESFATRANPHELTHTIQQFKLIPVDMDGNTIFGVNCSVSDLDGNAVTGPKGEEIWTDKQGRIKVKFHWDASEHENQFVLISCFSQELSTTEAFETGIKTRGGFNEIILSDMQGEEPIPVEKSNKNMIIKGKKILQNALPTPIDECRITTKTVDGDPDRPIIVGSIPNSGIVKLFNISPEKISADIQCKFHDEIEFGKVTSVEFKEKGTTIVFVTDLGKEIPNRS